MAKLTVGTTATKLPVEASVAPVIQNLGPGTVYFDSKNTVTTTGTTGGLQLAVGAVYEFPRALRQAGNEVWLISSQVSTDVRYTAVG